MLITGFGAVVAVQWCLITRAVGRAVSAWLAGSEIEAALTAWSLPRVVNDDTGSGGEVRRLVPVPAVPGTRPAKHRRAASASRRRAGE